MIQSVSLIKSLCTIVITKYEQDKDSKVPEFVWVYYYFGDVMFNSSNDVYLCAIRSIHNTCTLYPNSYIKYALRVKC